MWVTDRGRVKPRLQEQQTDAHAQHALLKQTHYASLAPSHSN